MGRQKLSNEQKIEQLSNSIIAGKHIKAYRTSHNWTQVKCAEEWEIEEITVRRYEGNAKLVLGQQRTCYPVSKTRAKKIAAKTGIIYPYWMGETECKTWNEYYAEIEQSESQDMADYIKEKSEELEQRRILFNKCGYHYKFLEGAIYDFSECSSPSDSTMIYQSYHPHQLTSFEEPDKHYYFNQTELDALISQMKDMIVLACFKKNRATQQLKGESQHGD